MEETIDQIIKKIGEPEKKWITVEIKKPLYGNFVYIRDTVLNTAIKFGAMLEIVIPNGKTIVDPVIWKKNGKVMSKVFKFADKPMVLYGGEVPGIPKPPGKIIKPNANEQPGLF